MIDFDETKLPLKLMYSRAIKVGSANKKEYSTQDYFVYMGPTNNEGNSVDITFYIKEKLIVMSFFKQSQENQFPLLILQFEGWLKTGKNFITILEKDVDVVVETKKLYQYLNSVKI